jgi:H+/Cl- antiporter ClcA
MPLNKHPKDTWIVRMRVKLAFYFDLLFSKSIRVNILQAAPFWLASFLVGIIAVLYSWLFGYAEHLLQSVLRWRLWMIFIMMPACFLCGWLIVRRFAPRAGGSGIPQVMAAIELSGTKHDHAIRKLLSLRIILAKIGSSIMMVLGGGAVGREGPTIQIAGSVFRLVNSAIPASWPKLSKQQFILTGAAAGLAAAFNTPLGGIIFSIEELSRAHIRYFRTALFTAVIIAGLTAQAFLGSYLYLGYPSVSGLNFYIFLGVVVTASVSGLLGALMSRCILAMMKWKRSFSLFRNFAFVLFASLLLASIAYFFNSDVLGSGKDIMNNSLFTNEKSNTWDTVLCRILGPMLAFNTGASGGIFAPSLAAGASAGGFISGIFDLQAGDANILILSGMVGFLTGVTRSPFTSAILVLEMTDRHSVIFHLMVAGIVSSAFALIVDRKSLYERIKMRYLEEAMSSPDPGKTG